MDKQESNYRLDVRPMAFGVGDFGDAPIVPGKPDQSPLAQYISGTGDVLMPPADAERQLTKKEVAIIRRWIDQGADWPDRLAGDASKKLTTDHWSFQPIENVSPPTIVDGLRVEFPNRRDIDRFISRKLIENDLQPSPPADRISMIRRIYLDMHGLQPTPAQVASFVDDESDAAYGVIVEEILASHHYGERWARHWLDVVRFGESTGYEVNRDRANAFYYRDYVIDALNDDKSYRDFVIEQLAGDAVGMDEGTGFLVGGPHDIVKSPDINLTLMQREDQLADYVNTTSTTFLGLTVGCARCHNHKFDPILQRDYYSLQAIFAGVEHGERQLTSRVKPELLTSIKNAQSQLDELQQNLAEMKSVAAPYSEADGLLPMVNGRHNVEKFDPVKVRFVRFEIAMTNQAEPCLDELEVFSADDNTNVALASLGTIPTSSGNYPDNPKHRLKHVNDGKYGNDFSWISSSRESSWVQLELPRPVSIHRIEWGRNRDGKTADFFDRLATEYTIRVSLDGKDWIVVAASKGRKPFWPDGKESEHGFIERLSVEERDAARKVLEKIKETRIQIEANRKSIPMGYVGTFKEAKPIHRLYRGDPMSPRELVVPDVLTVMGTLDLTNATVESERRLALANWIASPENPLTARVIVNRVWHYHFGTGLVSTPSDFGLNGGMPSHPELLDWLAAEFMNHNWSLKWLHREILLSSTYRQSSHPRGDALDRDSDCRLLWRFPPRRLEAEAIRDCILQVSGKLNLKTGGPGFMLFRVDRENVHHYFPLERFEAEHFRRMIYMTKIRQERDEVFGVFDCPDGGQTIPNRSRSTTPLQALSLFNSRFMIEQSQFFADRLLNDAGDTETGQVHLAFDLVFSREPTIDELETAIAFIQDEGLEAFCRALLNSSEFLFVS